MTVSTLRPASSASTASSWPGRKSSKPKISFRISCFELRLAPSRFIKLVPELGSRLRGLPPEPEGLKGGGQGGIRTPGTVTRTPHFECGAFDHSATCPAQTQILKTARKRNVAVGPITLRRRAVRARTAHPVRVPEFAPESG